MKNILSVRALSIIPAIVLFVAGAVLASPIDNVQEFQRKTVDSVLRNNRSQNFDPKQEYVEFISAPVSAPADVTVKKTVPAKDDFGGRK